MRLLALTHVSPRYFGPELAREAREVFPATVVPSDFDVIEVPFAERGEPQLVRRGAKADAQGADRDRWPSRLELPGAAAEHRHLARRRS